MRCYLHKVRDRDIEREGGNQGERERELTGRCTLVLTKAEM